MSPKRTTSHKPTLPFSKRLVLSQWFLSLFECSKFEQLAEIIRTGNDTLQDALDENNVHRFCHRLIQRFPNLPQLPAQTLLEYDQNIVAHTQAINRQRIQNGEAPIVWKYFQYLALLATEIYLDRYFHDAELLRHDIEDVLHRFNYSTSAVNRVPQFVRNADPQDDLNKIAYWIATGGGKTLLMHINIRQYLHYLKKSGKSHTLSKIILLTPNEGLSHQHLHELRLSGFDARLFDKNRRSKEEILDWNRDSFVVDIIDIHKLGETMGVKTVATSAFEGNNLVLIDEGHRGSSSGESGTWLKYRNQLCAEGFSFEYSATFAQAVKNNANLATLYSRSILFDYSYRFFYEDGFGKDYKILNLDDETQAEQLDLYMTACLLSFFQQLYLYEKEEPALRPFRVEKPLWIFVGSRVTKSLATKDASDIVEILKFLDTFIAKPKESIKQIERVLNKGIIDTKGNNFFEGCFVWLNTLGMTPQQIYTEIQRLLFNTTNGGAFHVVNLRGISGEIALKVGIDNEPFGVINVGDDAKLMKLCGSNGLTIAEDNFEGSLFQQINKRHSPINLLIGSKKFTEGWNSWRVSTMGLMNVGSTEGTQIIQLFGRGIRLKGFDQSLKRSGFACPAAKRPTHLDILETLSIFGIHADYMAQFRDFLKEEGVSTLGKIEFFLPTVKLSQRRPLKMLRLQKKIQHYNSESGEAYRRLAPTPQLMPRNDFLQKNPIVLNFYPKLQTMQSAGNADVSPALELHDAIPVNRTHITDTHLALLDTQKIYFELERFKSQRNWYNLNLSHRMIHELLLDSSWYAIEIPPDQMRISCAKIPFWQEVATSLMRRYIERSYYYHKRRWELPYLEYGILEDGDPNLMLNNEEAYQNGYKILIDRSQEEIIAKLGELKRMIQDGSLRNWEFLGLSAIMFEKHLYQPLLHLRGGSNQILSITPVELNQGEKEFVEDLRDFHQKNGAFFADKELYLLRNLSRGKGLGFFEAGNFYPDFILWLLDGTKQYISFIDPKGLLQLAPNDPKIEFYRTIKELEKRLGDTEVVLNSFLVSTTPSMPLTSRWGVTKQELRAKNVFFQYEDRKIYISEMIERIQKSAN